MAQTTPLFLFLVLVLILVPFSGACGITVYWGQDGREGTLQEACATGYYKYVAVAFLTTFGNGQTPVINLAGHCDPPSGTCAKFAAEISYCQGLGIPVLLSLGGAWGSYSINSVADAEQVAAYLWTAYLSGSGGPLGDAKLDGVDFDIEGGNVLHWDDLARAVAAYSTPARKIYLSAAPQCVMPDRNLDAAIKTGLFDFVWVQFYNNPPCDYSGGAAGLIESWNKWSALLKPGNKLFMGLPAAAKDAAGSGYIEPAVLKSDILPVIKKSANYGGIMLWSRYFDRLNNYSAQIVADVCPAGAGELEDLLISQVV